jgi:hypothetical protein
MSKMNRSWLVVAAALAVGASSVARGGGDNSMNPMYGDSYAALEGNGHNVGTQGIAPEGAYAAHEMDGQTTSLMDQMHRTQGAIAARTQATADRVRTAMNPNTDATGSTTSSSTAVSATPSSGTSVTTPPPASSTKLTGSTSSPSAAGPVVATPAPDLGEPPVSQSQPETEYRMSPVNPRGQGPTILGPGE